MGDDEPKVPTALAEDGPLDSVKQPTSSDILDDGNVAAQRDHNSWNLGYPGNIRKDYEFGDVKLGDGGFGVTWRGIQKTTGAEVAIKEINKTAMRMRGDNPVFLQREVTFLQTLTSHPNVVKLYGVYEDTEKLYLAMELCTGGELFDRIIARGRYSERDAAKVVRQMLKVVGEIHFNGVVHRDLKPENFLFANKDEDAPIKLIDFGLAARLRVQGKASTVVLSESVGTGYYMAPEVVEGSYTATADVWSIGIITYVMLCGFYPFFSDDPMEVYRQSKAGKINFARPPWPSISEDAKDFISHCLKTDPFGRMTAAQALSLPWAREDGTADDSRPLDLGAFVMMARFPFLPRMTKYILRTAADQLIAESKRKDMMDEFNTYDADGDGKITWGEFELAGKEFMGGKISDDTLRRIYEAVDTEGNGYISFPAFLTATTRLRQGMMYYVDWKERALKLFDYLDADKDGFLSVADLEQTLPDNQKPYAKDYIEGTEKSKDGKLSQADFLSLIPDADRINRRIDFFD